MKQTFKSFAKVKILSEGGDYGIPHIEDLEVEQFLRFVENLTSLEAVQKLDGANLRVGVDEVGEIFTSREQKGGKRFYSESEFPRNSSYDGFKAAHVVLEKLSPQLLEVLVPGESINLEIIYGPQPNTVFYGKDNLNYIALLEMLPGDDPTVIPDQTKIDKLLKLIGEQTVTVRTIFSDTTDGIVIVRAPRITDWKITKSQKVPSSEVEGIDFEKELSALRGFLSDKNDVAHSQGIDLTNFEVLKDRNRALADEKKAVAEKIKTEFKLPIKEKLLSLVYKQSPSLRGQIDSEGAYSGIEGIIFSDSNTREKFKVVDRDVFSEINKFNYQVRKSIAGRVLSSDPNLPIESRGGILGDANVRSLRLFGVESLELPSQTKKVLEKFKGETREETLHNLEKNLHQLNFQAVKRKIQAIYISALDDLEEALDTFKIHSDEYKLTLKNGSEIKYTKEIKRRTLMVFAEAYRTLIEKISKIRKADDLFDLLDVFFRDQIDGLYEEEV